jgi:hypothetical protein
LKHFLVAYLAGHVPELFHSQKEWSSDTPPPMLQGAPTHRHIRGYDHFNHE